MKNFLPAIFLLLLIFLSGEITDIYAEPEAHDGFYLNFQLGSGSDESERNPAGINTQKKFTGNGGTCRVKAGGAPVNNFIVYGVYGLYNLSNPDCEYGIYSIKPVEMTLTYTDYGLGICYYFMPVNIFISAEIAATRLRIVSDSLTRDSERGNSFTLSAGKEWWISDNWGLGAALILSAGEVEAGSELSTASGSANDTFEHTFIGIAFTATYN